MTIGCRIKELRDKKEWSLFDLSQAAGVREQTIRTWEDNRRRKCDPYLLARIADALDTTTDYLITGHEASLKESA